MLLNNTIELKRKAVRETYLREKARALEDDNDIIATHKTKTIKIVKEEI